MPHSFLQDLAVLGVLTFLEIILSIDNAVVLALLARHLPKSQQKKALSYGLIGALIFRLAALSAATHLMRWTWVKYVGGSYLIYLAIHHFWHFWTRKTSRKNVRTRTTGFWQTVILIELMDMAFAVDSILAATALSQKLWVVFAGGMIGVFVIRFAASGFIKLLEKFPRFEASAFLMIGVIGSKLILEGLGENFSLPGIDFHSPHALAFWIFWLSMATCLGLGFTGEKQKRHASRR